MHNSIWEDNWTMADMLEEIALDPNITVADLREALRISANYLLTTGMELRRIDRELYDSFGVRLP